MTESRILSERELAKILGLSPWTVRGMRLKENCPHFTVGKRIFYRLESVLLWIQAKEQLEQPENHKCGVLRRID